MGGETNCRQQLGKVELKDCLQKPPHLSPLIVLCTQCRGCISKHLVFASPSIIIEDIDVA
jgi:hypothetical protein